MGQEPEDLPVLVATWSDGVLVVGGGTTRHEMAGRSVRALAPDGSGGTLAIVDGRLICRRSTDGVWDTIARAASDLACCVAVGGVVYAGSDDAQVLGVAADGPVEPLRSFDSVEGRDKWYAGSAVIDGKRMGPPLGVRSMSATCDSRVLLVNVHVGGIPRSMDGGATWEPTIDIETDVHEVRTHPTRPEVVAAASAAGLCTSRDGGATWEVETAGLHASHCSAVAFAGDDILISAAEGQFAAASAIYRRRIDEPGPLTRVGGGLPEWLERVVDTGCIAAKGSAVAAADAGGNLYVSGDCGGTWSRVAGGITGPSNVLIV